MSGKLALKESTADPSAEQKENHRAAKSHGKAGEDGFFSIFPDGTHITQCVCFRDHGKQDDGNGAGQCIREENQRHSHAGKNTVDTNGGGGVIAIESQPGRDGDGFYTLKQVQDDAVGSQRKHHGQ